MGAATRPLLSPEELAVRLETSHQVFQVWASDGELVISTEDERAVQNLVKYLALEVRTLGSPESLKVRDSLPDAIRYTLLISPFAGESPSSTSSPLPRVLHLNVTLPLRRGQQSSNDNMLLSLQTPDWLDSSECARLKHAAGLDLQNEVQDGADRIMDTAEALSEEAIELVMQRPTTVKSTSVSSRVEEGAAVPPSSIATPTMGRSAGVRGEEEEGAGAVSGSTDPTTESTLSESEQPSLQLWAVDISTWPKSKSASLSLQPRVERLFAHEPFEGDTKNEKQNVKKVLRYLRPVDRTRALAALLLPRVMLLERDRALSNGDLNWDSLLFGRTKEGRPYLARPSSVAEHLDFNLTHDSDWVAMAYRFSASPSTKVRVGIDVMSLSLPHYESSVTSFLETMEETMTTAESKWVQEAKGDEDEGLRRLYDLWTYKEALTKAIGLGMGFDFSRVEIAMWACEGEREQRRASKDGPVVSLDGKVEAGYTFQEISLPAGQGAQSEQKGRASQLVLCESIGSSHGAQRQTAAQETDVAAGQTDQSNAMTTSAAPPGKRPPQISPVVDYLEAQKSGLLRIWRMEELVARAEELLLQSGS